MKTLSAEFASASISAKSYRSTNPSNIWAGRFDFALVGSSWDKRCLAITTCDSITFKSALEIAPFTTDPPGLLGIHRHRINEFLSARSDIFDTRESETTNLPATLKDIRAEFWLAIGASDRRQPARVFIDVSTCPRYFSLAILYDALASGRVGEIVIGYSEAIYPNPSPSYADLEDISFTDGSFDAIPIPGYYGEFEPGNTSFYLVSTGFDGWKTLNLLVRKDPERVAVLAASPGARPEYEKRSEIANDGIFQRFGVTSPQIVKSPAGDAVAAWRSLNSAGLENFEKENTYYLCSGNKAHSVALALRTIETRRPTLLYNRPRRHLAGTVECSGIFWAYHIQPITGTVFGR